MKKSKKKITKKYTVSKSVEETDSTVPGFLASNEEERKMALDFLNQVKYY